jgi:hypothetical protein
LGECPFGRFPDIEITVGNGLEKTVKLALYGTSKDDDKDD